MKKYLVFISFLLLAISAYGECTKTPASYRANNYGALTLRKHLVGTIPHYEGWPGYQASRNIIDAEGNEIMYFSTKEAGVAAWWAWFDRKGFSYDQSISLRRIAQIYGDNIPQKIKVYIQQWAAISPLYFGHKLKADEKIYLNNKTQRWALARTMFRHEAGPDCQLPLKQKTFERGLRLARDHLKKRDPQTLKSQINLEAYKQDN